MDEFLEEETEEKKDLTPITTDYIQKPTEYICHWPGCKFHTKERSEIELHHIIPRELWPRLNQHVKLSFCPTHHRMIYHPECKHGHHSIKANNKLMIHNIYPTAPQGYAVEFENMQGYKWLECFDGDYRTGEKDDS